MLYKDLAGKVAVITGGSKGIWDAIAVFRILLDHTVEHLQSIDTEGDYPRDFNFSQDENFIIAANQNSDSLTLFQRNPNTGKLTLLQAEIPCPEPICIQHY